MGLKYDKKKPDEDEKKKKQLSLTKKLQLKELGPTLKD
jgi:hypothetical protein